MKYGIIVNESSGSVTDKTKEQLQKCLEQSGLKYDLQIVPGNKMAETAHKLLKSGCDALVAGGGDGSIGGVAKVAIKANVPLGVLPLGTLNHFAGDLGIPGKISDAIDMLKTAKPQAIDYVSVNGHIVLNNSSIGIYPELVFRREDREKEIGKWPAAALSLTEILSKPLKSLRLRIMVDGEVVRVLTPCVFIGNNDYGIDSFGINQRKSIRAGRLSLFIFAARQRRVLFWHMLLIMIGKPKAEVAKVQSAKTVEIAGRKEFDVSIDGEAICILAPLIYRIHPLGLKVISPIQK